MSQECRVKDDSQMIAPRQKSRLAIETPVLFSLPNLRVRKPNQADLAGSVNSTPETRPVLSRFDAPQIGAIAGEKPATSDAALPQKILPVPSGAKASRSDNGRSWMERIGSRLILLVTLMVIVTAAWITGQRMPAGRSDNWSDAASGTVGGLSATDVDANATAIREVITGKSVSELSSQQARTQSSSTVAKLSIPNVPSSAASSFTNRSEKLVTETTSKPAAIDGNSVFNTVSMQSAKTGSDTTASAAMTVGEIESIPLAPPLPSQSQSATAIHQLNKPSYEPQTNTPNAPVVDPEHLLSWFNQNSTVHNHLKSATPNPITDWSRYLPEQPASDRTIRAGSETQTVEGQADNKQSVYPPGVMTNPFNK